MKLIDSAKLEVLVKLQGHDEAPCVDGKCDLCMMQKAILAMPVYRLWLADIFILATTTLMDSVDIIYPLHLAFIQGFVLAWRYRDTAEIEQLATLEDDRNDPSKHTS